MTATYALSGFRQTLAGIEALVTLDGEPVTVVTGHAPYHLSPARSWRDHGAFPGWAEREHGTVEKAMQVLIEGRRRT